VGVRRFDVHQVSVAPTLDAGVWKSRPCLVVSPDEMNAHLPTVTVAPIVESGPAWPTRVPCRVQGRESWIVLDQMRTVDARRVGRRIARLDTAARERALDVLGRMFAP
jgi:mRNA interferase MazF